MSKQLWGGDAGLVVLSGGNSTRMGQNKAFLDFYGVPLIKRLCDRLSFFQHKPVIITDAPNEYLHLKGVEIIKDDLKIGPLGGLYLAFEQVKSSFIFICACDMPFISPALVKMQLKVCQEGGWDGVIPLKRQLPEPLHGVYQGKTCFKFVKKMVESQNRKISSWYDLARINYLQEDIIAEFDPGGLSFLNINTLDDYQRSLLLAEKLEIFHGRVNDESG